MECRMDGRVALITGASVGLGKAMALKFACSGAKVALLARRPDVLAEAKAAVSNAGTRVEAYSCDVSDKAMLEATWAKVIADFGQVDVLVNNAGAGAAKPFESVTDAEWEADFALKVWPAIRLCRLALPGMKQRRWGRFINVLTVGVKAPPAHSVPTTVSRGAGLALTKVLANESAPHNVLVNALLAGFIDSDQWMRRYTAQPGTNRTYREFLDEFAKARGLSIGRVGEADEFASAACFLASDNGSYINGAAINVDGGMSPVV